MQNRMRESNAELNAKNRMQNRTPEIEHKIELNLGCNLEASIGPICDPSMALLIFYFPPLNPCEALEGLLMPYEDCKTV